MDDLLQFFENPENFRVLADSNGSCPPLSLRTITWFVNKGLDAIPSVRNDYACQLKKHTRRQFDPFRRNSRVVVTSGKARVITTVGQMNFFRWIIESGVWNWLLKHRARVHAEASRVAPRGAKIEYGFCRLSGPTVVAFD